MRLYGQQRRGKQHRLCSRVFGMQRRRHASRQEGWSVVALSGIAQTVGLATSTDTAMRFALKDVARWVAGEELLAVVPPCECVERCFGNQLVPLLNLTPQTLDRYTVLGLRA